jgi:hypothetical protein
MHHHAGAPAEALMPWTADDQSWLNLIRGHLCGMKILCHHCRPPMLHKAYQEQSAIFYVVMAAVAVGGEELMHALCAEPADDLAQRKTGPVALPSLEAPLLQCQVHQQILQDYEINLHAPSIDSCDCSIKTSSGSNALLVPANAQMSTLRWPSYLDILAPGSQLSCGLEHCPQEAKLFKLS